MPSKPSDGAAASGFTAISAVTSPHGRPRKLDRETVTHTALAIVEEHGLGGLTMRRVADELGVGLATLYSTASSKETILDDMIEMVFGQLPPPDRTPGREVDSLLELWSAAHELLFANPSVAQLIALKPAGAPGLLTLIESTLALLRAAGVENGLLSKALTTIRSYTLGFTLLRVSRSDPAAVVAERRLAEASSHAADRFPEIVALTPDMARSMGSEQFVDGLSHLLRGFLPRSEHHTRRWTGHR
jgi:AcrR family transcriptional regulator